MTFLYVYAWWHIPAAFTVLMLLWGLFFPTKHEDWGLLMTDMVVSLGSIAVVWAIAGFLK